MPPKRSLSDASDATPDKRPRLETTLGPCGCLALICASRGPEDEEDEEEHAEKDVESDYPKVFHPDARDLFRLLDNKNTNAMRGMEDNGVDFEKRAQTVDWIMQMGVALELLPEALHLAICVLDGFLSKEHDQAESADAEADRVDDRLLGCGCLMVGSKMVGGAAKPLSVSKLLACCEKTGAVLYEPEECIMMEKKVLIAIRWAARYLTIQECLDGLYTTYQLEEEKLQRLSIFLGLLTTIYVGFVEYRVSVVAHGVLLLASRILQLPLQLCEGAAMMADEIAFQLKDFLLWEHFEIRPGLRTMDAKTSEFLLKYISECRAAGERSTDDSNEEQSHEAVADSEDAVDSVVQQTGNRENYHDEDSSSAATPANSQAESMDDSQSTTNSRASREGAAVPNNGPHDSDSRNDTATEEYKTEVPRTVDVTLTRYVSRGTETPRLVAPVETPAVCPTVISLSGEEKRLLRQDEELSDALSSEVEVDERRGASGQSGEEAARTARHREVGIQASWVEVQDIVEPLKRSDNKEDATGKPMQELRRHGGIIAVSAAIDDGMGGSSELALT
ncbi:hypothetical protein OE88DRAFT_1808937 [Heliocybe sulcata]|uniref:Cyclin N-terminal domain-containing protein n=1 Tax=Heliocybe sulcata TaxID=5364 RepID=A0A5C3N0W8_9AGAM|nr:hypothetical protein OE88DRAFT_1808937 [Heliocybe sulcata]